MKANDLRRKRQASMHIASSGGVVPSSAKLGQAIQALTRRERRGRTKSFVILSEHDGSFEVRLVSPTELGTGSVEPSRIAKTLKVGRRFSKDARFSRATQLIRQDESSETTASIAEKFDDTLENNRAFYDNLLLDFSR